MLLGNVPSLRQDCIKSAKRDGVFFIWPPLMLYLGSRPGLMLFQHSYCFQFLGSPQVLHALLYFHRVLNNNVMSSRWCITREQRCYYGFQPPWICVCIFTQLLETLFLAHPNFVSQIFPQSLIVLDILNTRRSLAPSSSVEALSSQILDFLVPPG